MKNWYQFFTAREELVPIRHIFHTDISHYVKFAHVVKFYVAYMRILHIDKKTQNLLHFAIDSIVGEPEIQKLEKSGWKVAEFKTISSVSMVFQKCENRYCINFKPCKRCLFMG